MTDRYPHVAKFLEGQAWAIVPEKLAVLREIMRLRASGAKLTDQEIRQRLGYGPDEQPSGPKPARSGGVAILPLYGFLCPKANMMTEYSGGTSLEAFGRMFRQAVADPAVGSIVIEIDSGGGSVYGAEELWTEIFNARKVKRAVAMVNPMAGSCAYWLATACEEIVVTPSGDVGSIGVYWMHEDISAHLEQEGVKIEFVSAGQYKVEGNPYEPLSEEARAYAQTQIDATYALFKKCAAKGRGVSVAEVEKNFGQGRMVMAREAVARGMADRIGTLDETITRLAGKKAPAAGARAEVLDGPTGRLAADDLAPVAAADTAPAEAAPEASPPSDLDRRRRELELQRLRG